MRLAGALEDAREAHGFGLRARHGSMSVGKIPIFAASLPIGAQLPGTDEADGSEKPEDEGGKPAEGEATESQNEEQDGEGAEKKVHGKKYAQERLSPSGEFPSGGWEFRLRWAA